MNEGEMIVINEDTADVVVFGGHGYIGNAFRKELSERRVKFFAPESGMINLLHVESVKAVLDAIKPTFVINCAGYTGKPNVDACEEAKEETYAGNVTAPLGLAQACKEFSIPFGHVSSGCIYNGYDKAFTEEDEPNFSFESPPCSYYSGTKAEAEEKLKNFDCYIWRLRIPFDEMDSPRSYITKVLDYDVVLNAENSVSHRREFVKACLSLWEKNAEYGIYNVTNTGSVTASEVLFLLEKHQNQNPSPKLINDIETFYKVVGTKAPRSNCVLDNSKLLNAGVKMRDAKEALEDAIVNWEPFKPRRLYVQNMRELKKRNED